VETLSGGAWSVASLPKAGSAWTNLWGVAVTNNAAWVVGTFNDPVSGSQKSLILRGQGSAWTVSNGPDSGSGDNILGGAAAVQGSVWAAGLNDQGGNRLTFLESHNA